MWHRVLVLTLALALSACALTPEATSVLARRLLQVAHGGGSFTQEEAMTMVAYLTRLANLVINDDTAFPWDTARVMDAAYADWDIGDPTKLNINADGWYWVGGDFTSLGTFYGGADNTDWIAAIGRNGITLDDTVVAGRQGPKVASSADFQSIGSPVYLFAGDYLQVYFNNAAAGNTDILIESNPSDGVPSGYLDDAGPGTISPHLFLIRMAGAAPA